MLECCTKNHTNPPREGTLLECCTKNHTNPSRNGTLLECCMKNRTNPASRRHLARRLYEKSYKSSSAWFISTMLFEKSHKFIRLPAFPCAGTRTVGEILLVGPRILPTELLPDTIYAKIGTPAGITEPVCEWDNDSFFCLTRRPSCRIVLLRGGGCTYTWNIESDGGCS